MRAARMYGYKQPLVLEEVDVPDISPTQVLVRVGGAGMCRSDVQLIDGYFQDAIKPTFPITPGHEIAGRWKRLAVTCPRRRSSPWAIKWSLPLAGVTVYAANAASVMSRFASTGVGPGLVLRAVTRNLFRCLTDSSFASKRK